MKKILYSFLVGIFLMVNACETTDLTKVTPSIFDLIKKDPDLSTLSQAVDKSKLRTKLVGTQFTLFAPVNSAFAGVDINSITENDLLNILLYHIAPSKIDSARFNPEYNVNFFAAGYQSLTGSAFSTFNTSLNANLFVTNATRDSNPDPLVTSLTTNGIFVNGAQLIQLNAFEGSDGVVHKINAALTPPSGFAGVMIAANPDLSRFNKLVNKAATAVGAPSFALSVLNAPPAATALVTLFAPTNAAMDAAGYTDAFIDGATPAALLQIARGQTINARWFSSDFLNRLNAVPSVFSYNTLQTAPARTVVYNVAGTFTGSLNANVSIARKDIVTANGVIHIVGSVLNN
jgi:uncharacterized surface protein with fasciclin (FAS1) repeats